MLPAAPPADAQSYGLRGSNGSFGKGFGRPGIGRGHNSQIRHGKFGSHRLRNRHSRSIVDRRSNKGGFRSGKFDSRGLGERRDRAKTARHFDHGLRHGFLPTYGAGYRSRDRDDDYESADDASGGLEDMSDSAADTQPDQILPVTPKWIRVDIRVPADGASTGAAAYAQSSLAEDCRNPTIEITVDGKPNEAFREDCRRAN